ncbi:MAG: ADP-ribosylglycohydrolase family protein [Oscillospiraceae bacterium]|nr:ADP-ribosylglycohydrolase family protein [Oscillospiraceae bacterium]
MSTTILTQTEKCKGAMLATAIGDALGWPNEIRSNNRIKKPKISDFFVEWTRSCRQLIFHDEKIMAGEYSDDMQMTLSVARSIIAGDWEHFFAENELPYWLNYERGGGSALLKATKSLSDKKVLLWQSNYTKTYFSSGGNGATMRILPHVIAAANKPDIEALTLDVIKDTLITHGHPRAFLGATCYAYALDYLLRKDTVLEYGELVSAVIEGQKDWSIFPNAEIFGSWLNVANKSCGYDYIHVWEISRENMLRQLDFIKASLKKGLMSDDVDVLTQLECFGKVNGAGDVAILAAIYLASRYASNPPLGIKVPAFSFGADTDTIASITGGLLGMLSGTSWIPIEWRTVQDYNCILQIAELLLAENKKEATKIEVADKQTQGTDWVTTPIGKMRLVDTREVPNVKLGIVYKKKWQTALGQTLYIKDFKQFDNQMHINRNSSTQMRLDMPSHTGTTATPTQLPTDPQVLPSDKKQESVDTRERQKQFILNSTIIKTLFEKPEFKENITVGKVLKVIKALIETDDDITTVANHYKLDEAMIELIRACIK